MSDRFQTFVPVDMHWQPARSAAEAAVAMLWEMSPETSDIEAIFPDRLEFQDSYGGVRCATCETDLQSWFYKEIVDWYKTESNDLGVVTPCCRTRTTMDALRFDSPVAFYRFSLVARNSPMITDDQIERLETCLGTKLKVIGWRL